MSLRRLLTVSMRFLYVSFIAASLVVGFFLLLHSTSEFPQAWRILASDLGRPLQLVATGSWTSYPPSCSDPITHMAYTEACAHREVLARALGRAAGGGGASTGIRWTLGSGDISLWNRLHRAEEA